MKEDEVISFQFNVSDVQVVVAAFHEAVEVGSDSVPYPMNATLVPAVVIPPTYVATSILMASHEIEFEPSTTKIRSRIA